MRRNFPIYTLECIKDYAREAAIHPNEPSFENLGLYNMAKFWLIEIEDKKVDTGPASVLVVGIILMVTFVPKVAKWLGEWQEHDFPLRLVSGFYYYTVAVPVSLILSPWKIVEESSTDYPILNFVLAIIFIVALAIISLFLVFRILSIFGRFRAIAVKSFFVGPWILFAVWFFVESLFWQPEQNDAPNKVSRENVQAVADINHTNMSGTAEAEVLKPDSEVLAVPEEVTVDTSSNTTGVSDLNIEHAGGETNLPERVEKKGFFRKLKNIVF